MGFNSNGWKDEGETRGGGWLLVLILGLLIALVVSASGCVTAVDHAGEDSTASEELFDPWTAVFPEASGAKSYSVMTFTAQGCLYDELVRLDAAGNVESRVVYKGTWEANSGTLDLREPGEPEVLDHYELRGDDLVVDGVTYRRGRLLPPTLVGTWKSQETGGVFMLGPGGHFTEPVDLGYYRPGLGLGTDIFGWWWVDATTNTDPPRAGRLDVNIGSFTSQAILWIEPYRLQLDPGGTYDLVPNN